jgi:aryl sulfotransferase
VAEPIVWPVKQREIEGRFNSALWNGFKFRKGDIVIATPPKTGTTLTQQIVGQLVFGGDPDLFAQPHSPWIEGAPIPNARELADVQTHRRFLKTHLPIDALVYSPDAKYIYVGRDARDVAWALYNHMTNYSPFAKEELAAAGTRLPDKCPDIRTFYNGFIEGQSPTGTSFWDHVSGWWKYRNLPNLLMMHFANLITDRAGSVRQIADFLDIELSEGLLDKVVRYSSVDHMKELAAKDERLERQFVGGGNTFINKGTNGRWRDVLSDDEIAKCDRIAAERLHPGCAHWLRTGDLPND